jgi:hypothetical protein
LQAVPLDKVIEQIDYALKHNLPLPQDKW